MPKHIPVLLSETLHYLRPQPGDRYLDVTAGYGGHAQAVVAKTKSPDTAVLIDRDPQAIAELETITRLKGAKTIHGDFLAQSTLIAKQGEGFDMIFADLGISSPYIDSAERGFSIRRPGPLDMRMDTTQEVTAAHIVNSASEKELASIFAEYGEEPKSRQFARRVIEARPIATTDQLTAIAETIWRRSRQHPATRVFQALRIAVNDELDQLRQALPIWLGLLAPGGRLAVISFHSLEDRIVKRFLADHSSEHLEGELQLLTKKPVTASKDETDLNPRARSAKLRAAAKIKTKRKD